MFKDICRYFLLIITILLSFNAFPQNLERKKYTNTLSKNESPLQKQTSQKQNLQQKEGLIIEKAVKTVFGIDKPEKMEPLNSGFSGAKLYKILVNNKFYVLRVKKQKALTQEDITDRENEIKCMNIAADAKVSPKVYYANIVDGVVIMDYIDNQKLKEQDRAEPKNVIKLAMLLQTIHNLAPFPKSPNIPIRDALYKNVNSSDNKLINEPMFLKAKSKLRIIEPILSKIKVNKSCHNDLIPPNVLYDNDKFWVIDWEYANYDDPFFDLATGSIFFIPNTTLEELYLKTYFQRTPSEKERAHYYVMKQVSLSFFGIGLMNIGKKLGSKSLKKNKIEMLNLKEVVSQIQNGKLSLENSDHLTIFGTAMLKEALSNMESPYFEQSLSLLASNY